MKTEPNLNFDSFLARCERVEAKQKRAQDRDLYRSIIRNKSRRPLNRQSVRKETAKRFREASEIKGRKHQVRNPYWGDGPFNTVRPGRHKE